jgi:hypothetical protein
VSSTTAHPHTTAPGVGHDAVVATSVTTLSATVYVPEATSTSSVLPTCAAIKPEKVRSELNVTVHVDSPVYAPVHVPARLLVVQAIPPSGFGMAWLELDDEGWPELEDEVVPELEDEVVPELEDEDPPELPFPFELEQATTAAMEVNTTP